MPKAKILIAAGEAAEAKKIQGTLQKLGYSDNFIAYSAKEAIEKAEKESPNIVLIETILKKDLDGIHVGKEILDRFDIPIIFITTHSMKKILDAAKETNPYGFLFKPFKESSLEMTLDLALHKHKLDRELKEQERRLREFMNTHTDAICFVDSDFNIIDINRSGLENWNLERKAVVGKNLVDFVEKRQNKKWQNLFLEVLKTGRHFTLFGIPAPQQFGERIVNVKVFKASDGLGLIVTDITDQRNAEKAWRQSEKQYQQLVENINEGILMQDKNGVITYVNDIFLKMIGYSDTEVLGHKSTEFLGSGILTRATYEGTSRNKGSWQPRELAWIRKDGKRIFTILSPKPIYDDKGQLKGSVSILTDISARREVEIKLNKSREQLHKLSQYLQSVREKESARIAREIHDELGQKLTAIKMDISMISRTILSNEEEQQKFLNRTQEMSDLIDTTIQTVQKISAELRPGLLDDLGLMPALEWLSQDFQSRSKIHCKLQIECDDIEVEPDLATAIFRISQEALTNIARHANATEVNIRLREWNGKLELRINDNGKGIGEKDIFSSSSLGLMGMRERLRPFGGELKIDGIPQIGTTLIASLTLKGRAS